MTATEPSAVPAPAYVFSDDPTRQEATRHRHLVGHLAEVYDHFTIHRLEPLITAESRCLEVAAGAGTIAAWLAERTAEVVATDVDTSHIRAHRRLRVMRHNVVTDPLEADRYHLIHVRLLLGHLPEREQVVDKLVTALAPGGWLVVEEFQPAWDWCVLDAPDTDEAARLFGAYQRALTGMLAAAGNEVGWGRRVHKVLRAAGLAGVHAEWWARSWYGGQAGALLPYDLCAQVRPKLIAAGMPAADIDTFRGLLLDPRLVIHGNLAISSAGMRP